MSAANPSSKALDILESARMLIMDRGFNGFSFRDVAASVGIKSASIHYHYATKADLAEATAQAYSEAFKEAIAQLEADTATDLLRAYGGLFVTTLREHGRLCLGGMLAADVASLPDQVRTEVAMFFTAQNEWVENAVRHGQTTGEFRTDLDAAKFAKMFVSSLEGAMMISRGIEQPQDLEDALEMLIQLVQA
ncbi:MAG: TetR/AcrR family transcriptional regulator [Tateyamaria sp.]|uniref:TetR/AcrR family transcriptional regulator n=1 Tax=Tateyamaria sp. TaxID=1929288 RepID=UPI0032A0F280